MSYQLQFNIFSKNYSHVSSQDAEVSGAIVALVCHLTSSDTRVQDRHCTCNVTLRHVRATIVVQEKAISITCSECL
jgi:hypothetical protein